MYLVSYFFLLPWFQRLLLVLFFPSLHIFPISYPPYVFFFLFLIFYISYFSYLPLSFPLFMFIYTPAQYSYINYFLSSSLPSLLYIFLPFNLPSPSWPFLLSFLAHTLLYPFLPRKPSPLPSLSLRSPYLYLLSFPLSSPSSPHGACNSLLLEERRDREQGRGRRG